MNGESPASPITSNVADQSGKGFTAPGLANLHAVMDGYVARGEIPGLVTAVCRRDELHVDAMGTMAAGGKGGPVARDSIFRISSVSKPITAAAAMILVDEGKFTLDEPVDRLLPELANRRVLARMDGPLEDTVPARRAITVRDLFSFRLGFGIVMAPPGTLPIQRAEEALKLGQGMPAPATPPAPDEWIRRLGTLPLMHQPGEKWMYGTGADVLGVLVARASGRPFAEFIEERLFEPLGMKDTGFYVPESKASRFLTSYVVDPKTGGLALYDDPRTGQWSRPPAFAEGSGGMVSTADDLVAFGRMMLRGGDYGGKRVLSEASIRSMRTDQLTPEQKAISGLNPDDFAHRGWGLGMSLVTSKDTIPFSVGTFGWDGGMGTSLYCDPVEDLITVLLTQRAWPAPVAPKSFRDFWDAAYAASSPKER